MIAAEAAGGQPRTIGRYRIEAEVGEGAMAHVFSAHDPSIDRRVAIKVLKPELRQNPEVVSRFLAESRAAGMLSHANIVTIYDVGEADGIPHIAMEFLEGEPLEAIFEHGGRLTSERVLGLGSQIAAALAYAHARGVVHRDIKPSNILICDKGRTAKILDFGIARVDDRDEASTSREASRTQAGQVMGTPRYMSPEQAMGLNVDARSDLFSFGSVLYEMITGKCAFPGNGLAALAIQIAQKDPAPIASHVGDCPRGLTAIVARLLAKKPADRFTDAETVHRALLLEKEVADAERGAPRHRVALSVKLSLTLAVAAAAALALGVGLVLDRQKDTLEQLAMTSGVSMADFVANNAALRVAENAGLPEAEQDWLPLQAFVETASRDRNIHRLLIVDGQGVVRAAGDAALVGTRYRPAVLPTDTRGLSFVRPVRFSGKEFGRVDLVMGRAALDGALAGTRWLLLGLSIFVVAVVTAMAFFSAGQLTGPLRRLRRAMTDTACGKTASRLSHHRTDEVGALFDAFNHLVDEIDFRAAGAPPAADAKAAAMTRIEPSGPHTAERRAA